MKVLYLSHGDPDIEFSGVPLIAKQYLLSLKQNGHEGVLLLPGVNTFTKNFGNKKDEITKFYWPSIDNWSLQAFQKKPDRFSDLNLEIDYKPDIIHILDWINFSPSVLKKLKSFNVPIVRHILNFEDFCYFTSPIFFHSDNNICKPPLSSENCSTCILKNKDKNIFDKIKSFLFNRKEKLKKNFENRQSIIKEHFINYFDHLIFPSSSFAEFFFEHYKDTKQYSIINLGIERPKDKKNKKNNDSINIIFCGGADLRKGWFVIENTFKRILIDGLTNFNLRVYGHKKKTSQSSLSKFKNINFFESYSPDEIDTIFGWADLAIVPTLFEGYSKIVREFMVRGVIPISTDAFGIPDIVKNNVNGIIIKKPLENNLYITLKNILLNREILEYMKNNLQNIKIIEPNEEFKKIQQVYQTLINKKII